MQSELLKLETVKTISTPRKLTPYLNIKNKMLGYRRETALKGAL